MGCQPSWDAVDSPGCPTFLLALSKKRKITISKWNISNDDRGLTIYILNYFLGMVGVIHMVI